MIWFVEPISYFPIVGVAGTYMAFVSGNISNLRIPCAMIAQKAAGVEPGTDRGSIVATLGMAVSIIVNVIILAAGIFAGAQVLISNTGRTQQAEQTITLQPYEALVLLK